MWKYLLWPLGVCFLGLARLRARLMGRSRRRIRLSRPVISVGNLTFGGTGKTPVTVWVARQLHAAGLRPAVLLRGYGRASRGARLVEAQSFPTDVGDEAVLLARSLPGVPVAVGERREEAAALVPDAGVYVLDDAFQHLRVERDLDLLVIDGSRLGDLHAPPLGRLREPLSSATRADWALVTRGTPEDLPDALRRRLNPARTLAVRLSWEADPRPSGLFRSWADLRRKPLVAFAAIGNPGFFFRQAREFGLDLAEAIAWPDHAFPTEDRVCALREALDRTGAEALLTTEKDAVKWTGAWPGPEPVVYPELSVHLADAADDLLEDLRRCRRREG